MRAGIRVSGSFSSIILAARSEGGVAQCPLCGARSRRIHSRYDRRVADLPMQARKYGSASSRGGSFARCLMVGGGFSLNGWGQCSSDSVTPVGTATMLSTIVVGARRQASSELRQR